MALTKVPNSMLESPGAGGNVQSGTLTPSTIEAASPTAVIDHVNAEVAVVLGAVPSPLNSLEKIADAINNDATFVVTVNAGIATVGNTATLAQSTADTAAALAATKQTAYAAVNLGGGSSFNVSSAANAQRANYWTGSGAAVATYLTTGAVAGDQIPIANVGSGTLTISGVIATTGYKTTISAGEIGGAEFQAGAWRSLTPSTSAGSTTFGVVTGTGTVGSTLTFTPTAGFIGTYQWYRADTSSDVGGATSATYVVQAGDASHSLGCKFTLTRFETNAISISGSAPGQVTSFAFGTPTISTLPYSFVAPATGGAPTSYEVYYRTPPSSGAYTQWGGHSGTSLTGTITGLASGTSYEGYARAVNGSGNGTNSATATATTSSTKITFTDNFTADTIDARWTQVDAGWTTTSVADKLTYTGAGWGFISADCTAGDNTLTALIDIQFLHTYPSLFIRYVDVNNYVGVYRDGGAGELWEIISNVGGSFSVLATDSGVRGGTGGNANSVAISSVGNLITVTFTGGLNPGSFSFTTSSHATATKVAFAQVGSNDTTFDNAALS